MKMMAYRFEFTRQQRFSRLMSNETVYFCKRILRLVVLHTGESLEAKILQVIVDVQLPVSICDFEFTRQQPFPKFSRSIGIGKGLLASCQTRRCISAKGF